MAQYVYLTGAENGGCGAATVQCIWRIDIATVKAIEAFERHRIWKNQGMKVKISPTSSY